MSKSQNTKIQIPITKKLKEKFDRRCESMGFYSSNDVIRSLIQSFANNQVQLNWSFQSNEFTDEEYVEQISGELEESLGRGLEDIKHGRSVIIRKDDPDAKTKIRKLLEG